jgi:VWFA-related protein
MCEGSSMRHVLPIMAVAIAMMQAAVTPGQQGPDASSPFVFSTQTSVVVVPALVRTHSGELVFTLKAQDFVVTDDGVRRELTLEQDTGGEPLALVVVVEIGGAGAREFDKLGSLAPMLESLMGNVAHTVAVVAFDSQPTLVQGFTPRIGAAIEAVRNLTPGCTREHHQDFCQSSTARHDAVQADNGAAILDSLGFAVDLLRHQPLGFRRAILLVSETLDRGSQLTLEQAVRSLTDTNATIYSIGFSTAKSEAMHYASRQLPLTNEGGFRFENPYPNPPHGCVGKDPDPDPDGPHNKLAQFYDCLVQLAPPLGLAKMAAIGTADALQRNVPQTVARLTGGEYFKLTDAKSLERDLSAIANHLPNRYVLSFHPQSPHPGLHIISVRLPEYPDLQITARRSYWAEPEKAPSF